MREISLETQEILKSQKMIGGNKFNYEVKLEGTDYYTDIKDTHNRILRSGAYYGDICARSDGKILVTYRINNKIMLSVVDTEEELLTGDNVAQTNEWEHSTITYYDDYIRGSSLLRLKNGKILLFVYERGNETTVNHEIRVYISENGLGTDFNTYIVINSYQTIGKSISINSNSIGKAIETSTGRIILPAIMPYYTGGTVFKQVAIIYSDDLINWNSIRIRSGYSYIGDFFNGLCEFDNGKISFLVSTIDGATRTYAYESTDNGNSWVNLGDISNYALDGFRSQIVSGNDGYNYLIWDSNDNIKLYRKPENEYPSGLDYYRPESWEFIVENNKQNNAGALINIMPRGNIILVGYIGGNTSQITGYTREEYSAPIKASSISISKGRGGANSLSLSIDNSNGAVNPFNPQNPLYGIVGLNKQIIVKQGYGQDLIETFTGRIDTFNMKSFPHTMEIQCRDNLKKALDQTITESGKNTVYFESHPIENIFGYLCYLAGIETGEIEETGINISKEFSWQSYADAFQFLADLASFEYGADEYGKVYFRRDFQPDEIEIAYTFEEGIDITSLSYELSDKDLYSVVKVYGKSGDNVISYSAPFPDAAKYNILPQKILKVDATEAATINELKKIADRSIYLMNSRTAVVNFNAIAVPWLQVGDFIQVNETSSMSAGIYRISSLNLKMDNSNFVMDLQCYYYGDSVEIGTLPEDTATQTPNAELNLIPEMTSNTAPAGVSRASSVLKLYENDYQPWNALNSTSDDLYWNAVSPYGWIEYQFTEKTIVDKYTLKARQAIDYNRAMPKNFTFEGFDGEKWIVLDTRSNQTSWGIHEVRSYEFNNTVAYSKYRLNVTANNGFHRLQLEQLGMFYRGGV